MAENPLVKTLGEGFTRIKEICGNLQEIYLKGNGGGDNEALPTDDELEHSLKNFSPIIDLCESMELAFNKEENNSVSETRPFPLINSWLQGGFLIGLILNVLTLLGASMMLLKKNKEIRKGEYLFVILFGLFDSIVCS